MESVFESSASNDLNYISFTGFFFFFFFFWPIYQPIFAKNFFLYFYYQHQPILFFSLFGQYVRSKTFILETSLVSRDMNRDIMT